MVQFDNFINENKLNERAKDSEFNKHLGDFQGTGTDFTIEWNVKDPNFDDIPKDIAEYEVETGAFVNKYSDEMFKKMKKKIKTKQWSISDWSFAGRMSGWWVLLCEGNEKYVTENQLDKLQSIIDDYWKNFNKELKKFYEVK